MGCVDSHDTDTDQKTNPTNSSPNYKTVSKTPTNKSKPNEKTVAIQETSNNTTNTTKNNESKDTEEQELISNNTNETQTKNNSNTYWKSNIYGKVHGDTTSFDHTKILKSFGYSRIHLSKITWWQSGPLTSPIMNGIQCEWDIYDDNGRKIETIISDQDCGTNDNPSEKSLQIPFGFNCYAPVSIRCGDRLDGFQMLCNVKREQIAIGYPYLLSYPTVSAPFEILGMNTLTTIGNDNTNNAQQTMAEEIVEEDSYDTLPEEFLNHYEFGGNGGRINTLSLPKGHILIGFHGGFGGHLHNLGVITMSYKKCVDYDLINCFFQTYCGFMSAPLIHLILDFLFMF